jgi:hypothetical protein
MGSPTHDSEALITNVERLSGPATPPHLDWALALAAGFEAHLTALIFATEVMEKGIDKTPQTTQTLGAGKTRKFRPKSSME